MSSESAAGIRAASRCVPCLPLSKFTHWRFCSKSCCHKRCDYEKAKKRQPIQTYSNHML